MEESSKNNDVTELVDKAVIVVLLAPLTVVTLLLLLLMIEAIDEKSSSSEWAILVFIHSHRICSKYDGIFIDENTQNYLAFVRKCEHLRWALGDWRFMRGR